MRKEVKKQLKSSCERMVEDLKEATPVDTGRARDSWKIEETQGMRYPLVVKNNVPYIERLNAGSSKQAPSFFVERIALQHGKPDGTIVTVEKSNPEA